MFLPQRRLEGLGRRRVKKNPYIASEYVDSFDWKWRPSTSILSAVCLCATSTFLHRRTHQKNMEVPQNDHAHGIEQYELSSMQDDPDAKGTSTPATTYTRSSSRAALHSQDPQEGATVQELPPIDRGIKAWTFCFSAFVLEMMVWGFSFRFISHLSST